MCKMMVAGKGDGRGGTRNGQNLDGINRCLKERQVDYKAKI